MTALTAQKTHEDKENNMAPLAWQSTHSSNDTVIMHPLLLKLFGDTQKTTKFLANYTVKWSGSAHCQASGFNNLLTPLSRSVDQQVNNSLGSSMALRLQRQSPLHPGLPISTYRGSSHSISGQNANRNIHSSFHFSLSLLQVLQCQMQRSLRP